MKTQLNNLTGVTVVVFSGFTRIKGILEASFDKFYVGNDPETAVAIFKLEDVKTIKLDGKYPAIFLKLKQGYKI